MSKSRVAVAVIVRGGQQMLLLHLVLRRGGVGAAMFSTAGTRHGQGITRTLQEPADGDSPVVVVPASKDRRVRERVTSIGRGDQARDRFHRAAAAAADGVIGAAAGMNNWGFPTNAFWSGRHEMAVT